MRNPLERVARHAIRRAAVNGTSAGDIARGVTGSSDSQEAGSNGPVEIDTWATYGLTNFTPGGTPFRCKSGYKDW